MKKIPVSYQGVTKTILVDDEDFDLIKGLNVLININNKDMPYRNVPPKGVQYLHRMVMKCNPDDFIHHKNNDYLDIRKSNLVVCTKREALCNKRIANNNTSGFKGVSWNIQRLAFQAKITSEGRQMHLGYFAAKEDAAMAYDAAAIKYFGEFARTNKMLGLL
jgi:hypothetical protein